MREVLVNSIDVHHHPARRQRHGFVHQLRRALNVRQVNGAGLHVVVVQQFADHRQPPRPRPDVEVRDPGFSAEDPAGVGVRDQARNLIHARLRGSQVGNRGFAGPDHLAHQEHV